VALGSVSHLVADPSGDIRAVEIPAPGPFGLSIVDAVVIQPSPHPSGKRIPSIVADDRDAVSQQDRSNTLAQRHGVPRKREDADSDHRQ
jgi:hypothetical protein